VLLAGFEPVPPQAVLAGQKDRVLDDTAGVPCLLREGLEFVQAPDEEQISDLLDDFEWVTDATLSRVSWNLRWRSPT
jgi:hypothetical protein